MRSNVRDTGRVTTDRQLCDRQVTSYLSVCCSLSFVVRRQTAMLTGCTS